MTDRISYVTDSAEPVTVDEVKLSARIDGDALDTELQGLIAAARTAAEHLTGRCYRPQVRRQELADWPGAADSIDVHQAAACRVTYWTGTAWSEPLPEAAYVFAPGGIGNNGTVLAPATGTSWPTLGARPVGPRVRIDLTAGPASPDGVDDQVKLFIKAHVAAWVKNPEAIASNALAPMPLLHSLLDSERLWA